MADTIAIRYVQAPNLSTPIEAPANQNPICFDYHRETTYQNLVGDTVCVVDTYKDGYRIDRVAWCSILGAWYRPFHDRPRDLSYKYAGHRYFQA